MAAETDVTTLLESMDPAKRSEPVVYVSVPEGSAAPTGWATVLESEGLTVVLTREEADAAGYAYDFVGAWITLRVHSSLEAVGLTAAVSAVLTAHGIACNVIAGFYHDHIVVPWERADEAIDALNG